MHAGRLNRRCLSSSLLVALFTFAFLVKHTSSQCTNRNVCDELQSCRENATAPNSTQALCQEAQKCCLEPVLNRRWECQRKFYKRKVKSCQRQGLQDGCSFDSIVESMQNICQDMQTRRHRGRCLAHEFPCDNMCVPFTYMCDGMADCEDLADEANCQPSSLLPCPPGKFMCAPGRCIPNSWRCDGDVDCSQGTDEEQETCNECGCNKRFAEHSSKHCFVMGMNEFSPEDLSNISASIEQVTLEKASREIEHSGTSASIVCQLRKLVRQGRRCRRGRKRKRCQRLEKMLERRAQKGIFMSASILIGQSLRREVRRTSSTLRQGLRNLVEELVEAAYVDDSSSTTLSSNQLALSVHCPGRNQQRVTLRAVQQGRDSPIELRLNDSFSKSEIEHELLSFELPVVVTKLDEDGSNDLPCTSGLAVEFVVYENSSSELLFDNSTDLQNGTDSPQLVSAVVGAKFSGLESFVFRYQKARMFFPVKHIVPGHSTLCAYWNETLSGWMTDGCQQVPSPRSGLIACECNHLTNFALILVPASSQLSPEAGDSSDAALSVISLVGGSLSCLALSLTILNILLLRRLRCQTFQRILLLLSVTMISVYVLLMTAAKSAGNEVACKAVSVVIHFGLLMMFSLMIMASGHLYVKIVGVFEHRKTTAVLAVIPALGPATIVALTAGPTRLEAYGNENYCLLKPGSTAFYASLVVPLAVMVLCNTLLFVAIIRKLASRSKIRQKKTKSSKLLYLLLSTLSLAGIMGLTWISAILLLALDQVTGVVFRYLFVLLNAFQGVIIFVFYVVMSKEVRSVWLTRYVTHLKHRSTTRSRVTEESDQAAQTIDDHSLASTKIVMIDCDEFQPSRRSTTPAESISMSSNAPACSFQRLSKPQITQLHAEAMNGFPLATTGL